MPHRDPLTAILGRCAQIERRIAELGGDRSRELARRALAKATRTRNLDDAVAAEHALDTLLREVRSEESEPDEDRFAVERDIADSGSAPLPDPRTRLRVMKWLVACASLAGALGVWLAPSTPAPHPSTAARSGPMSFYSSAVVTDTRGASQATRGDRCTVAISIASGSDEPSDCHVSIICPGVERDFHPARCEAPVEGAPFRFHDASLDIDGETGTITIVDVHGQGGLRMRVGSWR